MTSDTECIKSTVESQHKQPQQSQSPHGHPPEPRAVRRAQSTEPGTDTDTCTGAARRRVRAHNYPSSAAAAAAGGGCSRSLLPQTHRSDLDLRWALLQRSTTSRHATQRGQLCAMRPLVVQKQLHQSIRRGNISTGLHEAALRPRRLRRASSRHWTGSDASSRASCTQGGRRHMTSDSEMSGTKQTVK